MDVLRPRCALCRPPVARRTTPASASLRPRCPRTSSTWLPVSLIRQVLRQTIWRLRNRLIVTYIFIAVVPIVLIVALAAVGSWIVVGQVAVYLVNAQLERRAASLLSRQCGSSDQAGPPRRNAPGFSPVSPLNWNAPPPTSKSWSLASRPCAIRRKVRSIRLPPPSPITPASFSARAAITAPPSRQTAIRESSSPRQSTLP